MRTSGQKRKLSLCVRNKRTHPYTNYKKLPKLTTLYDHVYLGSLHTDTTLIYSIKNKNTHTHTHYRNYTRVKFYLALN